MKLMQRSWSSALVTVLLVTAALPVRVQPYKILMIPLLGQSHVFSMAAIAEGLINHGHNVTLFIGESFWLNLPELRNRTGFGVVRYKDAKDGGHMDHRAEGDRLVKEVFESGGDKMQLASFLRGHVQQWCQCLTTDNDDSFDKLERENFDAAVVDGTFFAKCLYLIPHRLHIPWISFGITFDPFLARVPWLPSFVVSHRLVFSERMSFTERLQNTAALFFLSFIAPLYFDFPSPENLDKFRRYGHFSSLDELVSKSAFWMLAVDNVLDYNRPMMPNMVRVGGLTVKRSTGKLPDDIQKFIDGSNRGIILMTFGTVSSSLPTHIAEKFTSAFRRLDGYRVIWKYDNKDRLKLPDNVMTAKWLSQNEILAHPSVKLFITHCGNNGQHEAVYHGVPMIGFPLFGDQEYNAKRLDHKGYGLSMNSFDFTADELFDNIHMILGDKSYKERVMKASEIFRSQAQSPVERATFWIEHVCRFGGDHLRSAGNDLPLYSYLMLDIIAFALIAIHIFIYLLYKLIKIIASKCCERTADNNSLKVNVTRHLKFQ